LDLRVPLCYDSIKDVPNFQRFNQWKGQCDVKTIIFFDRYRIQTGSKHTFYNKHNFLVATVVALQYSTAEKLESWMTVNDVQEWNTHQ
jgi:hypothetical protein